MRSRHWAEWAWTGAADGAVDHGVLLTVEDGRITGLTRAPEPPADAGTLHGLTLPGLANAHSHAFHRALRGRTHTGGGSFWTWREAMYRVADRLDPHTYLRLARGAYAEMALAGITSVGEFHYLHHAPGGTPYPDPDAMGRALVEAARWAGIRLTLLDVCYLSGGLGTDGTRHPLTGPQRRFGDGDAGRWAERIRHLELDGDHARAGVAAHSVRALTPEDLAVVARTAHERDLPLHVHVSEQPDENTASLAAHGRTPVEVLDGAGALGPRTSLVHATHLTDTDVALVRGSGATVCLCPTTERDLADGLPRTGDLLPAPLSLGTDQHVHTDLFAETRGAELHERLRTHRRGTLDTGALLRAATHHASLGWEDAGALRVGARADLVNVPLDGIGLAGTPPERAADAVVFAATAAHVRNVMADGRWIVCGGEHMHLPDAAEDLDTVIKELHT
ncbi:formimidoylglutamate deiminase [Nocardiopsis xinjiangensis]|uniref:formimidoylglutamate deiminase n=1 Tax=Nocardiopsis xinjiangensis TaxID=124285 RepID=UPI00034CE8F8|nr:formimidoylglutamate deiminase [Nocardiopsis xinjiangensis]